MSLSHGDGHVHGGDGGDDGDNDAAGDDGEGADFNDDSDADDGLISLRCLTASYFAEAIASRRNPLPRPSRHKCSLDNEHAGSRAGNLAAGKGHGHLRKPANASGAVGAPGTSGRVSVGRRF